LSAALERVFGLDWPSARVVRRALEHATGLAALDRAYSERPAGITGDAFVSWTLKRCGIEVRIAEADLLRIPACGPLIVVANHPFGGIEGVALAHALKRVRPDVKLFANFLLARIPELRDHFIFVDPFARPGATAANTKALRSALSWLGQGGLLVVFPAGEVSALSLKTRRIADPTWSPAIARIARRAGAPVLPVYVPGRNRAMFQTAGVIHPALRTALLPREFLARWGKPIELRIGTAVSAARLGAFGDDADAIAYLRDRTEILAARHETASGAGSGAIQPRRTPPSAEPIVDPVPPGVLAAEIEALPEDALLTTADEHSVYVARARAIPHVLREIGRLRELTFRDVGEGTGRPIDLDVYDAAYWHLFIWNRAEREIVGAYRLGPTDEIVAASGVAGLYTASLFRYDSKLFAEMGPALEMGRSFIRTEHQKSYVGLMLLWKGIGEFVGRNPRYATLFGPVSISAEYRSLSQKLIVAFLERNRKLTDWARWVRPTNPFREARRPGTQRGPANLTDLDDVSTFISEIESDQKGVPILLKQYLKLDGRLLSYNVDPDFANVLDVLILVDLRRTPEKALQRYMGRTNMQRFRAFHDETGQSPFSYKDEGLA